MTTLEVKAAYGDGYGFILEDGDVQGGVGYYIDGDALFLHDLVSRSGDTRGTSLLLGACRSEARRLGKSVLRGRLNVDSPLLQKAKLRARFEVEALIVRYKV